MSFTIEIATNDYTTAKAAVEGGADRLELCSALSEGGLTPSFALINQCRQHFKIPLFAIIRPRGGDFLYTKEEFDIIKQDALFCKKAGCDGVVIGFLNKDGTINKKWTAAIVEAVYPLEVTFHRAFDRCIHPFTALEAIIEAGCQRILTSGQQLTALKGATLINDLIKAADNRIIIMPGSGVRKENIELLAHQTGAVEFHASLKNTVPSKMNFVQPAFAETDDYTNATVDAAEVQLLRQALSNIH